MHVLLIEDDALIARELLLRWQGRAWEVELAADLRSADVAVARRPPDLVVLDWGLPDGDGLAWLSRLRERDRATPVLVLTARDTVSDKVLGLRMGADDYLVKPFAVEELDARLGVLMRRTARDHGESLTFGRLTWLGHEGSARIDGAPLDLLPREFEVLGMLVRRAPRLVQKRVLVEALAERNLELGDSAAEVYISRLRRKLAGSGLRIRTLRGFGYMLELFDEPDPAAKAGA